MNEKQIKDVELINRLGDGAESDTMMRNGILRVVCLYRVSSKGQVDQNDIPMQRIECRKFAEKMSKWKIIAEFAEKGVSGYKISAKKRDVIIDIRAAAEKKQFDVLLVFMPDRLGRKEDETPFIVEWFISKGIEVWSTTDGQIKLENHVDKLLNYITFWSAAGESEKLSTRIKTKHEQMVEDGDWRGGRIPYGYGVEHRGRVGRKNRPLYDLIKDEAQGAILVEIFDKIIHEGYGTHRLANWLNDKYPDPSKIWKPTTIRRILSNPLYTGRQHAKGRFSPVNEELRYISDDQYDLVQIILERHIARKYPNRRKAENEKVGEGESKTSVYGASLLSGLLYCAHCNSRLVGSYAMRNGANTTYHRPVYRDHKKAIKANRCEGLYCYSAKIIETLVLDLIQRYFTTVSNADPSVWNEQARVHLTRKTTQAMKRADNEVQKLQKALESLREEVIKSLFGESPFSQETLKSILDQKEAELDEAYQKLSAAKHARDIENSRSKRIHDHYINIKSWAAVFDGVSTDEKKMILFQLIERITVDRNYNIKIYFYIVLDEFKQALQGQGGNGYVVTAEAADTLYPKLEE